MRAAVLLALALAACAPAHRGMPQGGWTIAPDGWLDYCRRVGHAGDPRCP